MGMHEATVIGIGAAAPFDAAQELRRRLVGALEHAGARHASLLMRRQFRWSEQLLYDVHCDGGRAPLRVLVKRIKAHDRRGRTQGAQIQPRVRALAEFGALESLHRIVRALGQRAFTSVRPYACFSDLDAFAMEYRPGTTLRALMTREVSILPRSGRPGATVACRRAGEWLGLVHQALSDHGLEVEVGGLAYIVHVGGELQRHVAGTLPLDGELPHAAWRFIEDRIEADTVVRSIPLHGDLYPDNLVRADDGRLYAVDTTLLTRGPAEDDVARFLVGVDTLRARIAFGDRLIRVQVLRAAWDAFLDGYQTIRALDRRLLAASLARAYLLRWAELRAAAGFARPAPIVAWSRRRIDGFMSARLARVLEGVPA